jgi:DNA polymerase elongation subunit (family B)
MSVHNKKFLKKDIQKMAFHTKTLGAFVQEPNPGVVGLNDVDVIASVDAKSLYPTTMVNGNIGYDTLFARVYDAGIVGKTIEYIYQIYQKRVTDPTAVNKAFIAFRKNILQMLEDYISQNKADKAAELKNFAPDYYATLFYKIITYRGNLENIFRPQTDEEYVLCKCCLYPLLETLTFISKKNLGYSATCCNYIFRYPEFKSMYKDQKFYLFDNINSTRTRFLILNMDQWLEYYATKFNINPYGTLFYKHYDLKSFEVDNVLNGMASRKKVKDQGLVLGVLTKSWNSLTEDKKKIFYTTQGKIDDMMAKIIIEEVGDTSVKGREKQIKSLLEIDFSFKEVVDKDMELTGKNMESILLNLLTNVEEYKMAYQDGEKTSLNTGYGLYAMVNWDWSNSLIANSITNGGKIMGLKLFQQISANILRNERKFAGLE